jgi:U3 small nucleolar RNA-associated protein 3
MDNLKTKKNNRYSSDEEEVLAFGDDTDAEDSDNSDFNIEDDEEGGEEDENGGGDDDLDEYGASTSWGKKKSAYYAGNKIENEEDAELEEQEAKVLQSKMMKQLDTNDFGLDAFSLSNKKLMKTSEELESERVASKAFREQTKAGLAMSSMDEDKLEKIAKNLSKLSKKEKLEILKQESPELFELVRDFREKVAILII